MTNRLYPQTALLAEAVEFTGRHTVKLVSPNLNFRTSFYVEDAECLAAFCREHSIETLGKFVPEVTVVKIEYIDPAPDVTSKSGLMRLRKTQLYDKALAIGCCDIDTTMKKAELVAAIRGRIAECAA